MELANAIRKRRTIRKFKQLPVPKALIRKLIDAARMAPSAGNNQKLRYVAVTEQNTVLSVFHETFWAAQVKPRRTPVPEVTAPMAFVAVMAPADSGEIAHVDAGAAIENILLTAIDNDLGCCWIGAFNKEKVDNILEVPRGRKTLYLVALGYPHESPIMENIEESGSVKYYLDENDVLHVPKYSVEAITAWK
ncbi:MAG: hypothetical protein A2020_14360 [Lentisphaerae bacterium GWF2_45_14]|nr:MAG: hypothetical protein A2020_14360 [Lentisphaerae bacterium GWF2_45_14]